MGQKRPVRRQNVHMMTWRAFSCIEGGTIQWPVTQLKLPLRIMYALFSRYTRKFTSLPCWPRSWRIV